MILTGVELRARWGRWTLNKQSSGCRGFKGRHLKLPGGGYSENLVKKEKASLSKCLRNCYIKVQELTRKWKRVG